MGSLDNMLKAANVGSVRSDRDTTSGALQRMKAAAPRSFDTTAGASAPAIGVSAKEETPNVLPLAAPKIEAPAAKAEEPKFLERVWDTVKGTGKQSAGSYGTALNTLYAAGQNARDTQTSTFLADAKRNLETAQRDLAIMERYRKEFTEKEIADQQRMVEDLQKRVDAFGTIGDVQRSATQTANEAVDKLSESGAADIEKAKEGLGTMGRFAVDVGAAGLGMLGDAATGAALGVGALPAMALRGFGSGAAEARQEGAELGDQIAYGIGSAATSVATEKLFNMVKPFAKIFGKGATDDLVERAISRAVQRAGKTAAGKTAIEGVLRAGTGFVGEGAEEFLESVASPILKRMTYDPDAQFDLEQAIYDFAVGGALGALGGSGEAVTEAQSKYRGYKAQQPGGTDAEEPTAGNLTSGAENAAEGLKTPGNDIRPLKTGEEIVVDGQKNSAPETGAEKGYRANYSPQEAKEIQKVSKTFKNIVAGVDTSISDFFSKWRNGRKSHQGEILEKLYIGKVTDAARTQLSTLLGYPVTSTDYIITADNVKHIFDHHGNDAKELERGNLPLGTISMDDIAEVVSNPDNIVLGDIELWEAGRPAVQFEKDIGGGTVVYVQFDNFSRGTIEPRTMFIRKKGTPSSTVNTASAASTYTSKTIEPEVPSSDATIPQAEKSVNIGEEAALPLAAPGMETENTEGERRTAIDKRDVDELAKLWQDQAAPVISTREIDPSAADPLVSARTEKEKKTLGEQAREAKSYFVRKMVDAGDSVSKVGKIAQDRFLYPFYNMARASASAGINMISGEQTDVQGRRVGESLEEIFAPVQEKGDAYYEKFQTYLFDLHNIDRMSLATGDSTAALEAENALKEFDAENPDIATLTEARLQRKAKSTDPTEADLAKERLRLLRRINRIDNMGNKPVFDYGFTAEQSKARAAQLLREHPEFAEYRDRVRGYIRNMMRYRVDSGLITQEDADFLERYYPNYVPTYRVTVKTPSTKSRKSVQIGKTVGKAEGGTTKLLPLHEVLGRQTMQLVREGSKNRFGQRLLDAFLGSEITSELRRYVHEAQEYESDFSPDSLDTEDVGLDKENTFKVYRNGKLYEMTVDPSLFEAVKALSPDATESNAAKTAIRAGNNLFKALVTGYNPTFAVRNTARDLQTAGIYSRDGAAFLRNYPRAIKEIREDGALWKQYQALGGSFSSVFDYETNTVKKPEGKVAKVAAKIQALNMAMEQAPRLAEFISVAEKGDGSLESLMDAMHAAADVTVNFGRAGTLGKLLNANYVPFLNPGIQGFDKMIRRVTETKGAKNWASLVVRAAALGIAPTLLNAALYADDDEWEDLRDSDKDTNYMFKLDEGVWLKIPKGRELSILGMTADRIGDMVGGEEVKWRDFITTTMNQVAPANPLKTNILSAFVDADLFDPSSPGKTWYGGDIENQRLQGYAPGERYDSSTDVFSKWLGGQVGVSPKKINYLLDQYTGVVGDVMLPLLTPQAERNMFEKAFTVDGVLNNEISGKFYNEGDALTYAKNGGDLAAQLVSRWWNKQGSACSEIYAKIRKIEESDISDDEKKKQVRAAHAILNAIQKKALENEGAYRAAVERHLHGNSEEALDKAYREANRECFGAEYALRTYNKAVYEKAAEAKNAGVSFEDYYDYYFAVADIESDKDRNGETISGSKRRKVLSVIDGMDLSAEQKDTLYLAAGYSEEKLDEAPWNESEYQKYSLKVPELQLPELKLPDLPPLYLAAP